MRRVEKLCENKTAVLGFFIIVIMTVMCLLAPVLTKSDPSYIDMSLRYEEASSEHIFGCDQCGRDVFARLLFGGRVSIFIGVASALLSAVLGVMLGCTAAYFGKWVDTLLLYIQEILSCFPSNILLLVLIGYSKQMGIGGNGIAFMIFVFVLTGWCSSFGYIRGRIYQLRQEPFVESCKANGIGSFSIMFRHMLPNCISIAIFDVVTNIAGYILAEASLSFLGWGVDKGVPTWGNMINAANNDVVFKNHPSLWILPGLAIFLFVLGVNFFGNGLRDACDMTEG